MDIGDTTVWYNAHKRICVSKKPKLSNKLSSVNTLTTYQDLNVIQETVVSITYFEQWVYYNIGLCKFI